MHRYYKIILAAVVLISSTAPVSYAWDLEFGYQRLMPKLGTNEQEYESQNGPNLTFKPRVEETILGQSVTLGLRLEEILIQYGQVEYEHSTSIPAAALSLSQDTEVDSKITEKRLGASYHLERELAGIFFGAGLTAVEEKLTSSDNEWLYKGNTVYLKYGIDLMILSILKVRAEQIHFRIGAHNALINSFGIVFFF